MMNPITTCSGLINPGDSKALNEIESWPKEMNGSINGKNLMHQETWDQ